MSWAPYIITILLLSFSGCTSKYTDDDPRLGLPATNEPHLPESIQWFDASSNGAAGNRLALATNAGIIAVDNPQAPWTIHVAYGKAFENRTTFLPDVEPWNLVAAIGPRGPIIAYRSPQYAMYVAEWDGVEWTQGMLSPPTGEIYSFPALESSKEELILSFPVISSILEESRYSLIRLTNDIPSDLSRADRIDFPAVPLFGLGDLYLDNETLAVSLARDLTTVEIRIAPWETLATAPVTTLQGPSSDEPLQSLYSEIAQKLDGGFVVAITAWDALFVTETDLRDAIIYDLGEETATSIQTRDLVSVWPTPLGVAVVRTDAQAIYHIQILGAGKDLDLGQSDCTRFSILPDATTVSLASREGHWESQFGLLPDKIPSCGP